MVRRTRPQMRNCASGNLEIPGSLASLTPRNDGMLTLPSSDQRYRFIAFVEIEQAAQRFAALAFELRIVLQDAQRFVARLRDQLAMYLGARDAVAGQAALPDAQHIAFTAQF